MQSVAELESLLSNKDATLHMPFPNEVKASLAKSMNIQTEVTLFVQPSSIVKILDSVRTIVLNWELSLEEQGILGTGLTFTPAEREAATHTQQSIMNFYGPVSNPQIQQSSREGVQINASTNYDKKGLEDFLSKILLQLEKLNLPQESRLEAESEIVTIQSQLKSPKPKFSIIKESITSIRIILETAGGTIAAALLMELGKLILR